MVTAKGGPLLSEANLGEEGLGLPMAEPLGNWFSKYIVLMKRASQKFVFQFHIVGG